MSNPSYTVEAPKKASQKRVPGFNARLNRSKKTDFFRGTEQQMRFIDEWAAGNSVLGAAVRAGYSPDDRFCYSMIKNPTALALYNEKKQELEIAGGMTRAKFMGMLQEAYDVAKMVSEPSAMVAAAREVGKACGYYAPVESKISITGNVMLDQMNRMSDKDLLELVQSQPLAQLGASITDAAIKTTTDDTDEDEYDAAPPLDEPA